jgi:16S rRNA (uracil1498-N3)-methyltransferase
MELYYHQHILTDRTLPEAEAHHCINVMRHNTGDQVFITDGKGTLYEGSIQIQGKKKVQVADVQVLRKQEQKRKIHVGIVPVKSTDRLEFMIEKLTELGVAEISFIASRRCERERVNTDKLEMRAIAAVKQSHNLYVPKINPMIALNHYLRATTSDQLYVAAMTGDNPQALSKQKLSDGSVTILIGPEGDFTDTEMEDIIQSGYQPVSLGSHILRTETAAIYSAAVLGIIQ